MTSFRSTMMAKARFLASFPVVFSLLLIFNTRAPWEGQDTDANKKLIENQAVILLMKARQFANEVDADDSRDVLMADIAQYFATLNETALARETFSLIVDDGNRDRALKPFLEGQLEAKEFSEAQLTVKTIRIAESKAEAWCSLASAQWESGQRAAARKALLEAEKIYAQHKAALRDSDFLEQLAQTEHELGDAGREHRTRRELAKLSKSYGWAVDGLDVGWVNSESSKLRLAGRAEIARGDLDAARRSLQRAADSIESVPRIGDRAILLYSIASDQARAGDKEGSRTSFLRAIEIAKGLPEPDRSMIIRDIVREQAPAGYFEDSLEAVTLISDSLEKDRALGSIAVAEAEQVGLESGLQVAGRIQRPSEYDITLTDIAESLGRQKDTARIYQVVGLIHSPYMKSLALIDGAKEMIRKD